MTMMSIDEIRFWLAAPRRSYYGHTLATARTSRPLIADWFDTLTKSLIGGDIFWACLIVELGCCLGCQIRQLLKVFLGSDREVNRLQCLHLHMLLFPIKSLVSLQTDMTELLQHGLDLVFISCLTFPNFSKHWLVYVSWKYKTSFITQRECSDNTKVVCLFLFLLKMSFAFFSQLFLGHVMYMQLNCGNMVRKTKYLLSTSGV